MPKVTDEHRARRRQQILDGARRAFARHGYAGATVAVLEEAVGLSRGAIFSYFPTKLDLFMALAAVDRDRVARLWLAHGFDDVVRNVALEDPDWIGVHLEIARLLRTDPAVRRRWEDLSSEVEGDLAAAYSASQRRGGIRDDLSVPEILRFLGVVLDGLAAQIGAGYPVDVEGTLALVRSALAPT